MTACSVWSLVMSGAWNSDRQWLLWQWENLILSISVGDGGFMILTYQRSWFVWKHLSLHWFFYNVVGVIDLLMKQWQTTERVCGASSDWPIFWWNDLSSDWMTHLWRNDPSSDGMTCLISDTSGFSILGRRDYHCWETAYVFSTCIKSLVRDALLVEKRSPS